MHVFSSYIGNVIDGNIFEYGDQDLKNIAEGSKSGFGNGTVQWLQEFPTLETLQVEDVVDKRGLKKARNKKYFKYLVKWKNYPMQYST